MQSILETIIKDLDFESMPPEWQDFDVHNFSFSKKLYGFQSDALKNAVKVLYLYFERERKNKETLFSLYKNNGLPETDNFLNIPNGNQKYYEEQNYPMNKGKISFSEFMNRACFWMATGSGKTLVIVKIMEILKKMMNAKLVENKDILFLAHKDILLQQFRNHVDEFNSSDSNIKIKLKNLKDYAEVKNEASNLFSENEITIFYYRSDLIADEHKKSIIDFKKYDNNGNWYIFLDEAHKGDNEDSKAQAFYNILSRNGFLFNFSATFTDRKDRATCAFNFNLEKFIREGYGKHIYLFDKNLAKFQNNDFSKAEKQKIILKALILQTYICKKYKKIYAVDETLYHKPLLMTLVNSVNAEGADLKLFFNELVDVARNKMSPKLFTAAKSDLINEFKGKTAYSYEEEEIVIDDKLLNSLEHNDLLEVIFNSKTSGDIEILRIPGNNQEAALKLKTTTKPFALIKIGDIGTFLSPLRGKGYEIIDKFEHKSLFQAINDDDSQINILMGSRSFYEGWDSNRPNVALFINIGLGDANKFILQSIGRGVRIEPKKHMRQRLKKLLNSNRIDNKLFSAVNPHCQPIETLFVYGTNAENLQRIITGISSDKKARKLNTELAITKEAKERNLLIPVYKKETSQSGVSKFKKFTIASTDFEEIQKLFSAIGEKIALMKYSSEPGLIAKFMESLKTPNQYYNFQNGSEIPNTEFLLSRIINYFNVELQKLDSFKKLNEEIIHFQHIQFTDEDLKAFDELKDKIAIMRNYPEEEAKLDKQYGKISRADYDALETELRQASLFSHKEQEVAIKYIADHYYLPIIVSQKEKVDYLNYIIDVPSERSFIDDFETYLENDSNFFRQFDWWMFSKIDHRLDEIFTPYYNPVANKISNFFPDFVFWMQKDDDYTILFIDPKGTEHTASMRKIEGFWQTIGDKKSHKHEKLNVKVKLLFHTDDMAKVLRGYENSWFTSFDELPMKLKDS